MFRTFIANEFLRPADQGTNRPVLVRGRSPDGESATIFLKTRAGYGDRPNAPAIELFTTLLARQLGLKAPEPVIVQIPNDFDSVVFDAPAHRDLIAQSLGPNFGTISLGEDWKTWSSKMPTRSFSKQAILRILAFDALVQQTDRTPDVPNLMWRNDEIVVLDHEKCFSYLGLGARSSKPWRNFFQLRPLDRHTLRQACSGEVPDLIQREFVHLLQAQPIPALAQASTEPFTHPGLDLASILDYFSKLNTDTDDFFEYFAGSLSL